MKNVLGHHMLVEFYNCNPEVLDNVAGIERHMNDAARACNATIVTSSFHRFEPWGVSGVVVISESHLAIHTWPEYGYASVDLYTCGDIESLAAYEHLKTALEAKTSEIQTLKRGNLDLIKARLENQAAYPAYALKPLEEPVSVSAKAVPVELQQPVLAKGGAA